jgi:hypothetical protein
MWLKPGADSGTPFYGEEIDVRVRSQLNNLMWSTLSALHENPTRYRGGRGGKRRKKKRTTNKSRH